MLMSQRDMFIDVLDFTRRLGKMSGSIQLDSMPRLESMLSHASGDLEFEVSGETLGEKAFLSLKLKGPMQLICQRCLGPFALDLVVDSRVLLVEPGQPWPDDAQVGGLEDWGCDVIEASRELDLAPLLEDEILLALPISPRHEHCEPPKAEALSTKASPFDQLRRLKRN